MVYEFVRKTPPSVPRRLWWFNVLLVATQCSVVPGSRPSPGKRGGRKARGPAAVVVPRSRSGPQRSGLSAGMVYEFLNKTPPSVPRGLGWFNVLLVAIQDRQR